MADAIEEKAITLCVHAYAYFKVCIEFLYPMQGPSNGSGESSVSAPGEGTHPSRNFLSNLDNTKEIYIYL